MAIWLVSGFARGRDGSSSAFYKRFMNVEEDPAARDWGFVDRILRSKVGRYP